jgi:glycosyltransferase involved in cell wall biosynthesis
LESSDGRGGTLRLAVLMSLESPWARQVALQIAGAGHSVQVVDFEPDGVVRGYVSALKTVQKASVQAFGEKVGGVHYLRPRFRSSLRYLAAAGEFRALCHRLQVDCVLALYGGGWATLAFLSGVRPYAVYVVGSDVLLTGRLLRVLTRTALSYATRVYANGGYLALRARALAPRANVTELLMGVDPDKFCPSNTLPDSIGVLCTRGFQPVYNNEYLIEGLSTIPEPWGDLHVTFSSAGPGLERARSLADKLLPPNSRAKVQFLGGVTDDRLLTLLQESHLYLSLSRSDGTSISLLEALACGLFPVLSDIPQNREWISQSQQNGILVPLDDPRALGSALMEALGNPGMRQRASATNRANVLERASGKKNMAFLASDLTKMIVTPLPL